MSTTSNGDVPPQAEPQPAAETPRDTHGRFAKGNPGGPGNPFARRTAALRQAFANAVTDEDLQAIARACVAKARDGDLAAARLVLSYAVGKPAPTIDPDTLDVQEWQRWKEMPVEGDVFLRLFNAMPVTMANPILAAAWPHVAKQKTQDLANGLQAMQARREARTKAAAGSAAPEAPVPSQPPASSPLPKSNPKPKRTYPKRMRGGILDALQGKSATEPLDPFDPVHSFLGDTGHGLPQPERQARPGKEPPTNGPIGQERRDLP